MGEIRFIDLFSGIGGFRLGLERANKAIRWWENAKGATGQESLLDDGSCSNPSGAEEKYPKNIYKCVWSCDIDKHANKIYTARFGEENHYTGDIRGVDAGEIPDHDLLCAGFPCQAFSIAGKRKGFQDTRGTLFFEICRIAEAKRPSLLLLENVKGLLNHDEGNTFQVILESLDELGYWVEWQVLNSKYFGVPQNRERVFIIGHLRGRGGREVFPITAGDKGLAGTQEAARGEGTRIRVAHTLSVGGSGRERNLVANTIRARYHKDGSENLIFVGGVLGEKNKKWLEDGKEHSRNFPQGHRVYSAEGIGPTLSANAGGWGGKTGLIAIQDVTHRNKRQHGKGFKIGEAYTLTSRGEQGILKVGNIFPSGHEAGDVLDTKGISPTLRPMGSRGSCLAQAPKTVDPQNISLQEMRIRRLTPTECERLQGFPDGWTEGVSDTQRYKVLGNAVTVNVIEFLGKRIMERVFNTMNGGF